jgi:CheY-like chemotaxis protein
MRVLVVDDDQETLETFFTLLQLWGHEVRVLSEPALALSTALEFLPDIAFLDISMPEIDGCQVAMLLRQHKALDSTFLVAVTGYGSKEDHEKTHAAGFDVHLVKPVEPRNLQLLLKRRLYPAPRTRPINAPAERWLPTRTP